MFNYATYNGVPVITYGLIGLTASIFTLVTFNPSILELNADGKQTTIADAIGLDKIQMPAFISPGTSGNAIPRPFSGDDSEDKPEDDSEDDSESDDDEPISEQSSVTNPLRQDVNPSGGRKTQNKRKNKRKTKRKK